MFMVGAGYIFPCQGPIELGPGIGGEVPGRAAVGAADMMRKLLM